MTEQHRLTRTQFERFFSNRPIDRVIMEACGSAHHFARSLSARGIQVVLLPAQYVRAYVRRNKTDGADEHSALPDMLRPSMRMLLDEIRVLETRIAQLERQWPRSRRSPTHAGC